LVVDHGDLDLAARWRPAAAFKGQDKHHEKVQAILPKTTPNTTVSPYTLTALLASYSFWTTAFRCSSRALSGSRGASILLPGRPQTLFRVGTTRGKEG
jgi:hypothetical protein